MSEYVAQNTHTQFRGECKLNIAYQKMALTIVLDAISCYLGYKIFFDRYANDYDNLTKEVLKKLNKTKDGKKYDIIYVRDFLKKRKGKLLLDYQSCYYILFEEDSTYLNFLQITPDTIKKIIRNLGEHREKITNNVELDCMRSYDLSKVAYDFHYNNITPEVVFI